MEIEVKKLTPDLLSDFLYFFDCVAFTDNPRWASCYCYYYHANCSNEEWVCRTAQENREATMRLIRSNSIGYLAYVNGKPVGWCHADSKLKFSSLDRVGEEKGDHTGAIVCFIVAPEYRRKGVAQKLLAYACESFKNDGFLSVQGYPRKTAASDAENYHGPLEMYLRNGFEVAEDLGDTVIVQKKTD